jgi:hypothetical protein
VVTGQPPPSAGTSVFTLLCALLIPAAIGAAAYALQKPNDNPTTRNDAASQAKSVVEAAAKKAGSVSAETPIPADRRGSGYAPSPPPRRPAEPEIEMLPLATGAASNKTDDPLYDEEAEDTPSSGLASYYADGQSKPCEGAATTAVTSTDRDRSPVTVPTFVAPPPLAAPQVVVSSSSLPRNPAATASSLAGPPVRTPSDHLAMRRDSARGAASPAAVATAPQSPAVVRQKSSPSPTAQQPDERKPSPPNAAPAKTPTTADKDPLLDDDDDR